MRRRLAAVLAGGVLSVLGAAPASAHDTPPPKHDDTGCCVSFDNSPVVLCMTADACRFTAPPTGGK